MFGQHVSEMTKQERLKFLLHILKNTDWNVEPPQRIANILILLIEAVYD